MMLSHTYDYRTTFETSQRVNWKLEDVMKRRPLDFTRPFLPDSIAGVNGIRCLTAAEKLKLNQIRGSTCCVRHGAPEGAGAVPPPSAPFDQRAGVVKWCET